MMKRVHLIIVVKFCSEGSLSLQHTDGVSAYSRHLSSSERGRMAGLLCNNSVSTIFNKQFTNAKRIILHVFGRMVKCKQIDEINQIFGLLCYVLCCKKQTSAYCNMLNQLEECVKGDITVSSNPPEEFEDETDVHVNGVTYREKSPFGRHFELIYHNILDSLSEVEYVSQPDPNSVSYSPQIIQFLLTYYMPLVPFLKMQLKLNEL